MTFKIYNNGGIYRLDDERGKGKIYEIISKSTPKHIKKLFSASCDADVQRGGYNFFIKDYTLTFSFACAGIGYLFFFLEKIIKHNIPLFMTLDYEGIYTYVVSIPVDFKNVRLVFLDRTEAEKRNWQDRYRDPELNKTVVALDIIISKYQLIKEFNQEFHKIYESNRYYLSKEYDEECRKNHCGICQERELYDFKEYMPVFDKYLENPEKFWRESFFNRDKWDAPTYKTVTELKKQFEAWKNVNAFIGSKIERIMIMGLIFNDDRPYYTFKKGKWYSHCFDTNKKNNIRYVLESVGPSFDPNKKEDVSLTLDEPLSIFFNKGGHLDIDFTKTARFMMKPNSFDFWEKSYYGRCKKWQDVSKYFSKNIIGRKVVDINIEAYSNNDDNIDLVEFVLDNGFKLSLETDMMTGYMSLSEEKG